MFHRKLYLLISALLLLTFFFSCDLTHPGEKPRLWSDSFSVQLQGVLKPVDSQKVKIFSPVSENLRLTYQENDYRPVWLVEHYVPTTASGKLLDDLEDMRWDGFDTGRYPISFLRNLKTKLDTSHNHSLADALRFDTTLTHYYLLAAKDLLAGRILPKKVDSLWYHVNDSTWDAPRILATSKGDYAPLDDYRSRVPTYSLLRDEYKRYYTLAADSDYLKTQAEIAAMQQVKRLDSAQIGKVCALIQTILPWVQPAPNDTMSRQAQLISAAQAYFGLRMTGKTDSAILSCLATPPDTLMTKLAANMERIRWMQREFGSLYLVVDIPLAELFLRKDGANLMHMRVVVGKKERQTPSLFANMANIVVNPQWGVPPTILKNDVLPGIEKSGKKYLAKKGLKAYDYKGKPVKTSTITAHNYNRYIYQQAPGDDNALGYVKFNLPNRWDIYLHDTPHRGDFGKRDRALSSGCIRLQRPQEMAVFILSQLEKLNFTQGKLDTMIKTHHTKWEILKNKIPVHITYLTAFEDTTGKHIQFVRDVYHRDEKLISVLGRK